MINYSSPLTEDFLKNGKSDRCPVIDTHAHMFNFYGGVMTADTPEKQVTVMDRSGVKLALIVSHRQLYRGREAQTDDLNVCKQFPDKFRMYLDVFSPELHPEADLAFMEKNPEAIGMKFHADTYSIPLSDSMHDIYYRYADERKLPILFHTWGGSPWDGCGEAEKVLERWQNISFIAGHSFEGDLNGALRLAEKYPNLYLELTAVLSHRGQVEAFVNAGFEDRILFGVDMPWFSYDFGIGALLDADITDSVREKILFRNAMKMLHKADIDLPADLKRL